MKYKTMRKMANAKFGLREVHAKVVIALAIALTVIDYMQTPDLFVFGVRTLLRVIGTFFFLYQLQCFKNGGCHTLALITVGLLIAFDSFDIFNKVVSFLSSSAVPGAAFSSVASASSTALSGPVPGGSLSKHASAYGPHGIL